MSSHSNRRIRAQRKRHTKLVSRLRDRLHTFTEQGRKKEALAVIGELAKMAVRRAAEQRQVPAASSAPSTMDHLRHRSSSELLEPSRKLRMQEWVGKPANGSPTSPVLEKEAPKVHGVNAQRESRSKPTVGGARGKRKPAS